ncbi:SDR family NAD(P)-dependent oxidoreductase [Saliphagus infecundisoli]|uniref:SDR family NAD(P)-dependent oxidoreductase n=1 Tax=Saliphagus infecundisoli TaxID=1849069 RepID=A0ABD5QA66_9EURY|nr:SDR family oxidoreductase [Saliphagus infecundisoli]
MTERLEDAVAVVIGGGAGIGETTCLRLAEAGADVVAVDWNGDAAEATAEAVEERTGREALARETDVGDEESVERMADELEERFSAVDVLVNNAGIRVDPKPVTEAGEESWDRILDANLKGYAFCVKHLAGLMAEGSAIVNVASVGAWVGRPEWAQYDATKGAIVSMTRDMACDFAPEGIRVNAVSPGWVITDYHLPEDGAEEFFAEKTAPHPDGSGILKRAGEPREIADAVSFLASDEASFITGTNLAVDGGTAAVGKGMEWDERFED